MIEYNQKKDFIETCANMVTSLILDDYSFFFMNPDKVAPALQKFSIVRPDNNVEDLNFLKAMIGLKSNKMQAIQSR